MSGPAANSVEEESAVEGAKARLRRALRAECPARRPGNLAREPVASLPGVAVTGRSP